MNVIVSYLVIFALLFSSSVIAQDRSSQGITTANKNVHQTQLTFQLISDLMTLNKQMVASVQLVTFDKNNARVEIILTTEATQRLMKIDKIKSNQKIIITAGDQIINNVMIQKKIDADSFLISISTSKMVAENIVKILS